MSLAIIIPYYKLAFFQETLKSLAQQTDQRFTVYIGNDDSPQDPADLLKEFEGKLNYVYKKFEENQGGTSLTKQWDRCIEMLQEEDWFMILGDDDVLGCKVVEEFHIHKEEANRNANVIRFATQLIDEDNQLVSKIWIHPILENAFYSYHQKLIGKNRGSLSEFIFKTKKYKKHKFKNFALGWSADDIAVIDFADNKPIFSINSAVLYVRIWVGSISGLQDNLEVKNKSTILSTKFLLKKHSGNMDCSSRRFFIKTYDHLIFSSSELLIKDFLFLQYISFRYLPFEFVIVQWKTFAVKTINLIRSKFIK